MAIAVVLNGVANDATVLEAAMRFAAKEHCLLRVFVGAHGDAELVKPQVDLARWFLETHEGLTAPEFVSEHRAERTEAATADELKVSGGDSWV